WHNVARREERKKPKNNEIEDSHTWHNAGWKEKPKKTEEQRNSRLSDIVQRSQERRAKEI
ncbi:hypothetical protein AVEN_238640-1, partial [Araneus ventricosus]